MSDPDDLLAAAYALDGPEANRALYARWAATYERFIADSRYVYHDQVAGVFARHGPDGLGPDDVIVDVGCGTGLAGLSLRRRANVSIDGIDISPEMLEQAGRKRHDGALVYRRLIEADLTQRLTVDTGAYTGAISVGTFTHGHLGPEALAEVVRIVRPGGRAAIGINAAHFVTAQFDRALRELVRDDRITDLQLIELPIYDAADMDEADQVARVPTFEVSRPRPSA